MFFDPPGGTGQPFTRYDRVVHERRGEGAGAIVVQEIGHLVFVVHEGRIDLRFKNLNRDTWLNDLRPFWWIGLLSRRSDRLSIPPLVFYRADLAQG